FAEREPSSRYIHNRKILSWKGGSVQYATRLAISAERGEESYLGTVHSCPRPFCESLGPSHRVAADKPYGGIMNKMIDARGIRDQGVAVGPHYRRRGRRKIEVKPDQQHRQRSASHNQPKMHALSSHHANSIGGR